MTHIESNIPIPERAQLQSKHAEVKAIFKTLLPGQSIFVETPKPRSLRVLFGKWSLDCHFDITTRRWEEGIRKGLRVWRVK